MPSNVAAERNGDREQRVEEISGQYIFTCLLGKKPNCNKNFTEHGKQLGGIKYFN